MFITFVLVIEYVLEFMESTELNAISKAYMNRPLICLLSQADHIDGGWRKMFNKIEHEVCEWLTFYQYTQRHALYPYCVVAPRLGSQWAIG